MAINTNSAVIEFLTNSVNLDPGQVLGARKSHKWLLEQIQYLPNRHNDFPPLYPEIDIHYGSFARNTKIRELDDVDLIVGIYGSGGTYEHYGDEVRITVPDGTILRNLCHDSSSFLNSKKVINIFKKYLGEIPQYSNTDITRNGPAVVLNLTSYTWSFDIVPSFFTNTNAEGKSYYLIPDGNGHWMKTDPRLDQERINRINSTLGGYIRNPMRLIKYWNRRPTMPSSPSYLLECICLNYFEGQSSISKYPDIEFPYILSYVAQNIIYNTNDPKNIEGNINRLSPEERKKVSSRASVDSSKALAALAAEKLGNHKEAIRIWTEIFGSAFPSFG
ncbi:hypothetical protein [Hymenobacter negativus]|uniref:Nucleotidyltransferase n=1 Tax=Hymenobacter negativus TaxID=2795026 RepID=A0ABS3Q994_9BACT|nr:hypothetical protein [Hymenobacter negativus]MBO2007826.1 hypothetical protein [Hymenobacter negativus]